jgi:hypothetical protein
MKLVLVEFYPLNECRTEIIPPEKIFLPLILRAGGGKRGGGEV